ncbi:MAG: hypothetical protein AAB613_02580 [Patescibacteria group bacterium]
MSKDHQLAVEQALRVYTRVGEEPTQDKFLVFHAGHSWYCFFCLRGEEYCDIVSRRVVSAQAESKRNANQVCNCDNYDNL